MTITTWKISITYSEEHRICSICFQLEPFAGYGYVYHLSSTTITSSKKKMLKSPEVKDFELINLKSFTSVTLTYFLLNLKLLLPVNDIFSVPNCIRVCQFAFSTITGELILILNVHMEVNLNFLIILGYSYKLNNDYTI